MTTPSVQRRPSPAVAHSDPDVPARRPATRTAPSEPLSPAARGLVERHARASGRSSAPFDSARVQSRLNDFMAKAAGPYRIGGRDVHVAPAFRMVGGMNQGAGSEYVARIRKELSPGAFKSVATDIGYVTAGKGTPEQVRRVTQALIDSPAGRRYPETEAGVRQLMWAHGIGMDCSGYVHHAFHAARGGGAAQVDLGDPLASGLQAPSSAVFGRVEPAKARPGDVLVLTRGSDGTGHKVIVFARHEVPRGTEMHARIARALGDAPTSQFHLLEVDSSWGAGGQAERGGVGRRVWAFDEGTQRWASLETDSRGQWHAFPSQKSGPYDHELQGVYRPRSDR